MLILESAHPFAMTSFPIGELLQFDHIQLSTILENRCDLRFKAAFPLSARPRRPDNTSSTHPPVDTPCSHTAGSPPNSKRPHAQPHPRRVQPLLASPQQPPADPLPAILRQHGNRRNPRYMLVRPLIPRHEPHHLVIHNRLEPHHLRQRQHPHQVQQRPRILRKTHLLQIPQPIQITPGSRQDRCLATWRQLQIQNSSPRFSPPTPHLLPPSPFLLCIKFSSIPVNSIGKIYLVAADAPIDFSVSKYCSVIVFGSTACADS